MQVRVASQTDYPQLFALVDDFYREASGLTDIVDMDFESMRVTFDALLKEGILLVVENNDILIGVLAAAITPLYFNRMKSNASELFWYVIPQARSNGSGLALLNGLLYECEKRGIDCCAVTNANNQDAEKVERSYMRNGFSPVGRMYMRRLRS